MNTWEDVARVSAKMQSLLSDPQPGLITWNEAVANCHAEMNKLLGVPSAVEKIPTEPPKQPAKLNTGVFAFPWFEPHNSRLCPGMALRDYFAAAALKSLPLRNWNHIKNEDKAAAWAQASYSVADAMLAERAK